MRINRTLPLATVALGLACCVAFAASGPTPLPQGSWTKKGYAIAGGWSVVEEEGQRFVVLDDAFSTKRAPDLKLFLSPRSLETITDRNATEDALLVSPLRSHEGAQRYAIPGAVDLGDFRSLIIHCEKYSKVWGGARLAPEAR